ncbi:phage tail assembly protein [Serratia marcescens]|uniref:phage tail assembly protein n=1 Tax=Serratia marcescens TaxID=615 RepID=UPI000A9AB178|nr:phage tail assembly protein [Serratia marcescens]
MMSEELNLPDSETIVLGHPVSIDKNKTLYTEITLCEPTMDQVDAFYKERDKNNVLMAMGALISMVSDIPVPVIKKLKFRDYKRCEVWLTRFLAWSPDAPNGGESSPT